MCRSPLRLLASLGLRRILGETSSLYQSGHASQSRPKRKRKMSTMVKATPCFLVSKDCRRRRPTAPLGSLALAVGTPYIQATLTILCTNQAVLDEWTRERVIPKFRSWQGRQASRRVPSGSPTVNYRQLRAKPCVTRRQSGRLAFERFQQGNEANVDVWAAIKKPAGHAFSARIDSGAERRGRAARDPIARGLYDSGTTDRRARAPDQVRRA